MNTKLSQNHIIFDLDSTLVTIEGLDKLAEQKGLKEKVSQLTAQAMNGDLSMRSAMQQKIDLLRPSIADLTQLGEIYTKHFVLGAKEAVKELQHRDFTVWILTGNFQPAVGIVAKELCIDEQNVISNTLIFAKTGEYLGVNLENPLFNNFGKATIIQQNKQLYRRAIMVGDGMTDLETKSVVRLFIGFGGVVQRPAIAKQADVYVTSPDLRDVIEYVE